MRNRVNMFSVVTIIISLIIIIPIIVIIALYFFDKNTEKIADNSLSNNSSWKDHYSANCNFKIKLPQKWQLTKIRNNQNECSEYISSPNHLGLMAPKYSFFINKYLSPKTFILFRKEAKTISIESFKNILNENSAVEEWGEISINNRKAVWAIGQETVGLSSYCVFIIVDKDVYKIDYSADKNDLYNRIESIKTIINSATFDNK